MSNDTPTRRRLPGNAGDLTAAHLGLAVTLLNVGPRNETVDMRLGHISHEIYHGHARTVLTSEDGARTVVLDAEQRMVKDA